MAFVGVVSAPLVFIGLSRMTGSLSEFLILSLIQLTVVGGTTTAVIYSRLIAQQFDRARGVALALAACTAPAAVALGIPSLSHFIDVNGWRAGYVAVAVCTALGGGAALLLIPRGQDFRRSFKLERQQPSPGYGALLRSRPFLLIMAGTFLCNLSFTLQTSHLKVILLERGIDSATGSWALALFATGAIIGRLFCGITLDRFPAYLVAAIFLGLPGIGLIMLASGLSAAGAIAAAVLLLGLAFGAEGDVFAYLVMKYFNLEVYSRVLGLVFGALALAVSLGSLLLSVALKLSGSYTTFLILSAVSVFIGSGMFMLLRREHALSPALANLESTTWRA